MKFLVTLLMAFGLMQFAQANEILLTKKNTVIMNQAFNSVSVAVVQQKLADLASKTKQDLFIVLDSPGGSISAGQSLIDFANSLPNKVHTITIFAASMAYLTAQHLGKRFIVPSGTMMSHRASISGLGGQIPGEAITRIKYIHKIVRELFVSTAKRVGVSYKEYLALVYDELWLTADQAVKSNHADEVIKAKCGRSLSGTHTKDMFTFFGPVKVTFSNCPLISGPLKIDTNNEFIKSIILERLNGTNKKFFELTLHKNFFELPL